MVLPAGIKWEWTRLIMLRETTLFIDKEQKTNAAMLLYGNEYETCRARLLINLLRPHQFNRIAILAMVVLLSACGGGTASNPVPAAPSPAAAPASSGPPLNTQTALVGSEAAAPRPAQFPWDDPVAGGSTVLPAAAPTDTGSGPPYPDLRLLPTQVTAFEPVVFGDVAGVGVTSAL